jgi:hypothetical protein
MAEENYITRGFRICDLHHILILCYEVKDCENGDACIAHVD